MANIQLHGGCAVAALRLRCGSCACSHATVLSTVVGAICLAGEAGVAFDIAVIVSFAVRGVRPAEALLWLAK